MPSCLCCAAAAICRVIASARLLRASFAASGRRASFERPLLDVRDGGDVRALVVAPGRRRRAVARGLGISSRGTRERLRGVPHPNRRAKRRSRRGRVRSIRRRRSRPRHRRRLRRSRHDRRSHPRRPRLRPRTDRDSAPETRAHEPLGLQPSVSSAAPPRPAPPLPCRRRPPPPRRFWPGSKVASCPCPWSPSKADGPDTNPREGHESRRAVRALGRPRAPQ